MKSIVVLSVTFKNFMLIVVVLNVGMLTVIMPNVVMPSAMVTDQSLKIKPKPKHLLVLIPLPKLDFTTSPPTLAPSILW